MRKDEVPQDRSFYRGLKRVCFAVDEDGEIVPAKSAGWSVERLVTEQALLQLEDEVEAIRRDVVAGRRAPLAYHIATRQMTVKLCAQHMGLASWRVKRHLRPRGFARLSPELLERYAHCLDLPVEALFKVPEQAQRVFFEESEE